MINDNSILLRNNIETSWKLDSKEKAIKYILNKLYIQKFIIDPIQVVDYLYKREKYGKTGLIKGICIPHVRHRCVLEPILYVLRLKKPIEWGTLDDSRVNLILLFISTEEKEFLKKENEIAALMHSFAEEETFEKLQNCEDDDSLYLCLRELIIKGEKYEFK